MGRRERLKPVSPDSVEKYLASKFGQALPMVRLVFDHVVFG